MVDTPRPTKSSQVDVIVTQGWGRIAYNIVRSLGQYGLRVGVGTDEFLGMAAVSRFTSRRFRHPPFITSTSEFVRTVADALREHRPAVYIPADQDVLVVAKHRDAFRDIGVKIPIAPFETLRRLHLKNELAELSQSIGLPTPATIVPQSEPDLTAFARQYRDPIVIKFLSSAGSRGVFFLTKDEIPTFIERHQQDRGNLWGRCLAQEYVQGSGYGVSMLFNEGKLRAKFVHKRLREQAHTGGISTLRVSTRLPVLEEYAAHLLTSVSFHGVAMVEFKYDEASGRAWLIEVNPRFWGSLGLAIRAGVDFPVLLYRIAVEGDVIPVVEYREGVVVKWMLGDLVALAQGVRRAEPAQSRIGALSVSGYDDFYVDDPFPFIAEVAFSIRKKLRMRGASAEELDLDLSAPVPFCGH